VTTVDSSGFEESLRRLDQEMDVVLPQALTMLSQLIANRARSTTLFRDRTGLLRKSILPGAVTGTFSGSDLKVDIMAGGLGGVNYAGFVHDGTRRMAARPFMREAAEASLPDIERIFGAAVRLGFLNAGFR